MCSCHRGTPWVSTSPHTHQGIKVVNSFYTTRSTFTSNAITFSPAGPPEDECNVKHCRLTWTHYCIRTTRRNICFSLESCSELRLLCMVHISKLACTSSGKKFYIPLIRDRRDTWLLHVEEFWLYLGPLWVLVRQWAVCLTSQEARWWQALVEGADS